MQLDNTTLAILLIIALVGKEVILLTVRKLWARSVDTEYVSVADCHHHRATCAGGHQVDKDERVAAFKELRVDLIHELDRMRKLLGTYILSRPDITAADRKLLEELLK